MQPSRQSLVAARWQAGKHPRAVVNSWLVSALTEVDQGDLDVRSSAAQLTCALAVGAARPAQGASRGHDGEGEGMKVWHEGEGDTVCRARLCSDQLTSVVRFQSS